MKKYFVITDVHGFYSLLLAKLNEVGYDKNNPDHILISCGDLMDRGRENKELLTWIMSIPADRRILIRGNHEDLLEDVLRRGHFQGHDYHNGTDTTLYQLAGFNPDKVTLELSYLIIQQEREDQLLKQYLSTCIDYYELDNYIFVHGWMPQIDDWKNGDWQEARWQNGMYEFLTYGSVVPNKIVVCGHYHCSWGHYVQDKAESEFSDFSPFIREGIIAFDACTAYSNQCNVLCLEV